MTNLKQLQDKVEREFDRKFGIDDDWDNELYQKIPSGWKSANKEVKQFISSKLKEAYNAGIEEILEEIKNKLLIKNPTGGYENSFNNRVKEILKENK